LTTKKFGVGKWELLKACLSREYLLMKRNSIVYAFRLSQVGLEIRMVDFIVVLSNAIVVLLVASPPFSLL